MSAPGETMAGTDRTAPPETAAEGLAATETSVRRVPYAFAKRYGVLVEEPGEAGTNGYRVLHRGPLPIAVIAELRRHLDAPFTLELVDEAHLNRRLAQVYDAQDTAAAMQSIGGDLDLASISEALPEPEDLLDAQDDAPIIRLINALLSEAIKENASDIHIEPFEHRLSVRLRVDGVMREVLTPPATLGPLLVSRVKIMAHLDIAEKRVPQDGRISLRVAGHAVDVRVSTLPSGHGERLVLRLLDKQSGRLDLAHLGLASRSHEELRHLIQKPHGMLLVTGPTGSGKTTTLYAALSEINDASRSILTVEDPVEYFLDGIGQTQVNNKVGLDFARGLRAILRQDPDVVMVGEIRDLETAEIAVQASLTGHLVFSTLHTNTAISSITRLRDMGVESFLLSSTLLGVVAQRLVRLLCTSCREPYTGAAEECTMLGLESEAAPTLYRPVGCPACKGSGYHGRSGIYELVSVDAHLRDLIHGDAGEQELERYCRSLNPGMFEDGRRRVLAGETTLEEVLRVTRTE